MSTLRFLFVVLLALNALAFVAIQGWLGTPVVRGEPERLANQLHPELIRLAGRDSPDVPTTAEPAPPAPAEAAQPEAPPICVAWAGIGADDAERLEAQLRAAGLDPQRSASESPSSWWVRIPPLGGRDTAERKARELKALGITDYFIVQDAGASQFAISLGLFKTEAGAERMVEELRARGLLDAGFEPRMRQAIRVQADLSTEARDAVERSLPRVRRKRDDCGR